MSIRDIITELVHIKLPNMSDLIKRVFYSVILMGILIAIFTGLNIVLLTSIKFISKYNIIDLIGRGI